MYSIEYEDHFHPYLMTEKKKSSYILSHGKGLPIICVVKNDQLFLMWYNNIKYLKINNYLLYTNINKLKPTTVLSATSSYFGALADKRMKTFLRKKISLPFRILEFLWFAKKDFLDFTTSIPIHEYQLQFADGCLWDCYGLHSVFAGLKHDGLLHNPLIIVFTSDTFVNNEWWEKSKKRHSYYPNSSIFKGKISDNLHSIKAWNGIAYANIYRNCELHEENPFRKWYNNGKLIDVIVICIHYTSSMPNIPTNQRDAQYYKNYEERIRKYIPIIFDKINLNEYIARKSSLSVCISGGACKTALLGMYALSELYKRKTNINVVVGTSGGAWGIFMYFKYRSTTKDTNFTDILLANCNQLKKYIDMLSSQTLRNIENANELSILTTIIPTLAQIDTRWEKLVQIIINGDNQERLDWKIFPSNLRVLIPISLLCNSHFGKK